MHPPFAYESVFVAARDRSSRHPVHRCRSRWPWNPIGAGDVDGNKGKVLSFKKTATSYHLVTRPMQWACHNVSCDCTFEQTVTLSGALGSGR